MKDKAVYVRSTGASPYRFNDEHPFSPLRVELAETLLEASGALPSESVLKADTALDEQLALIHRPDYIEAVRGLSQPVPPASAAGLARRFGLDSEDTPYFTGMHEAASAIVGGSIAAADAVLSGRALHAYHMGGGLHHAFPGHGSGFCVYNDAAIAIAAMRRKHSTLR